MTSLDERITNAGHEVNDSLASVPTADLDGVVQRASRRRTAMNVGFLAVGLAVVVGILALVGGVGTDDTRVDFAGDGSGTATTVAGDSRVSTLDDVPRLALQLGGWQLYEARDTSAVAPEGAAAVPARHVRYVSDGHQGGTAVVSLDLFGVPPGSFYETMVPLLTATEGSAVRIRGAEGRLEASERTFAFAWRESDATIAMLTVSGVGDPETALAIAEAFEPVSASSWSEMLRQEAPADRVTVTTIA